jgi:hypothetical protein
MFKLIAIENDAYQEKIGGPFLDHFNSRVVATFDTEKLAREYIEKSKLKKPIKKSYGSIRPFKQSSLLSFASFAEIESYSFETPPHNPKV